MESERKHFKVRVLSSNHYIGYPDNFIGSIQDARYYNDKLVEVRCDWDGEGTYYAFPMKCIEIIHEPIQTTDKHVLSIIEKFNQRSIVGLEKYGTTLERKDLSRLDWIEHAQQEAMDFILYLERLKEEV